METVPLKKQDKRFCEMVKTIQRRQDPPLHAQTASVSMYLYVF